MKKPMLTIVVPCYNEEDVLSETIRQLCAFLDQMTEDKIIAPNSKLLFVDDGSKDRTWTIISDAHQHNPQVTGLKLAGNVGHQKALLAGLETAKEDADCVISIDADLQDDIRVMRDFLMKFHEGYDIVYGVRDKRDTDTWFKRNSALGFYKLLSTLGIRMVPNHADFRLMSKRAVEHLARYSESNLFLRGIIPLLGFPSTKVYYDRLDRFAGESKYPLKKMLSFALDGIASFSVMPIRFMTLLGVAVLGVSATAGLYALIQKLFGHADAGWTSLMLSIWFIGGLHLMGIGIVGEYIGKIFTEVKRRPKYAVDLDLYTNSLQRISKRSS